MRTDAISATYRTASSHIEPPFSIREWSNSIAEIYKAQWCDEERHPDGSWDWEKVAQEHRTPREKVLAVLCNDRELAALTLINATNTYIEVRLLEGDPRPGCPLKGERAAIVLDFAANYAQRMGVSEIRLEPTNSGLKALYCDTYGFEEVPEGSPYLKRKV